MLLSAMLAMVAFSAVPAMAQGNVEGDNNIVEQCAAALNQQANGSQYATNDATQDADAAQYQYQPGGAGGGGGGGGGASAEDVTAVNIPINVTLGPIRML